MTNLKIENIVYRNRYFIKKLWEGDKEGEIDESEVKRGGVELCGQMVM